MNRNLRSRYPCDVPPVIELAVVGIGQTGFLDLDEE